MNTKRHPFIAGLWNDHSNHLTALKLDACRQGKGTYKNSLIVGMYEVDSRTGKIVCIPGHVVRHLTLDTVTNLKVDESEKTQTMQYVLGNSSDTKIACVAVEREKSGKLNIHFFCF